MSAPTTTTAPETTKIRLSEAPPVRVRKADWPVVAEADWHDGQVRCQANEIAVIRVRQHADGRSIVYGYRDSGDGGQPIGYRGAHAGYLLDKGDDIPRAIRRVAGAIDKLWLADKCISDLPEMNLE